MALTVFKSTDASAPVLTGQVGTLVALLDACLVSGYGAKTALGWGKPYTSTNSAVFRAASGTRHYLQIADNGADTNGAKVATGIGFETMSAYNTGTGLFPTAAQLANGTFWIKSATADATARAWTLIGDSTTFWLVIAATTSSTSSGNHLMTFGEFLSYKSADAYNTIIGAAGGTSSAGLSTVTADGIQTPVAIGAASSPANGLYVARAYTQIGSALPCYIISPFNTVTVPGAGGIIYPNAVDSGLYLAPIPLADSSAGGPIRGLLRGYFFPMHSMPLAHYDQISSVVGIPGVTFIALNVNSTAGTTGQVLFDITGPWP